jgi:hypothetical protein
MMPGDRSIIVEVISTFDARERNLPSVLVVTLADIKTEMPYRNYSTALAASRRIARKLKLRKVPARACWRSAT